MCLPPLPALLRTNLGQRTNEVVRVGQPGGRLHLCPRGGRRAVGNVARYCQAKEARVLRGWGGIGGLWGFTAAAAAAKLESLCGSGSVLAWAWWSGVGAASLCAAACGV